MVIIREKKTQNGVTYTLTEMKSGVQHCWTPPRNIKASQHDDILIMLATQLEESSANGSCGPIEQAEIDPETFCQIPFWEMTVTQFVNLVFIPKKISTLAEHTQDQWCSILKRYILPQFGSQKFSTVLSWQLEEYFTSLQQQGFSHSTVIKHFTIFKALCKMAKKRKVFQENPMLSVDRPEPRKDELKRVSIAAAAYTPQELAHIIACAKNEPLHWRLFIHLLIDTGMRRGEALALTWKDVDFKRKQVMIRSSVGYTKKSGIFITTPKNRTERVVSVSDETLEMLLVRSIVTGGKYVFPKRSDSNSPMHPQSPTYYFRKFGEKYGISNFHPHSLRHSFASCAIGNGADLASVSEVLGHYDKSFTLRVYTVSNPENRIAAQQICHNAIARCAI